LFASNAILFVAIGIMWQVSSTTLQSRIKLQLNTILFSKTLVKKDLASVASKTTSLSAGETAPALPFPDVGQETGKVDPETDGQVAVEQSVEKSGKTAKKVDDDEDVTSKTQIMVSIRPYYCSRSTVIRSLRLSSTDLVHRRCRSRCRFRLP
jgi:hypothetical protein